MAVACTKGTSSAEGLLQDGFELVAELVGLALGGVQLFEDFLGVAVILVLGVRVLKIEVVVAGFDVVEGDAPCLFGLLAVFAFKASCLPVTRACRSLRDGQ